MGGPLSEVPIEPSNQKGKKKKGGDGKKGQENNSSGNNSSQDNRGSKKKDKGKKKDKDSSEQKGASSGQDGRRGSLFAGSAFLKSPAPEELPMPSAALILKATKGAEAQEDGTAELKKMLNLDGLGAPPSSEGSEGNREGDAVATDDLRRMLKIS